MAKEPDLQAVARSFSTEIAARAEAIEQERRLPGDLARRMAEAGLFNMLVPARYGGGEADAQTLFDTVEAVSRVDGAVGWCLMIGATTGLMAASLPEAWAQAIYGDNPTGITCGVTAPLGRAQPARDGVTVTGRWPFGSGSDVAGWICGGCVFMENGVPRKNAFDLPETALVFFPREDVTIHDNWHASGLRGSGSNDIEVTNLYVPEGRWTVLGKRARVDAPLYRFPTLGLLALGVSAVAVGIAQHAIDSFVALATGKVPTGSTRPLAQRGGAQKDLAMAQAALQSGRALTRETIDRAWQAARDSGRLSREIKAELRLAATNNTWSAAAAVDRLYHAAGGSSVYATSDLQRCFRDVHVATQHIMVARPTYEVVGKVALGIDPKTLL